MIPAWFPTPLQQEVIAACVSDQITPDRLPIFVAAGQDDPAIRRLFPLLHHNLKKHGIEHPVLHELKGHQQQTWFANQRLLHQSEQVLRLLHEQSIPTMLLKGACLLLTSYDSYGLRPMSDIDILVPDSEALRAYELLTAHGWHMTEADRAPTSRFGLIPGINLEDHAGGGMDLHWFASWQSCYAGADTRFWERAVSQDLNGIPIHVPCPEDNLLHTLIHGARWNAIAPIRWITDALAILRSAESLNWQIFINEARQRKLTAALTEMLAYLHDTHAAPIPADVLRALQQTGKSPGERLENALRRRQQGEWRGVMFHTYNLIRLNSGGSRTNPLHYIRQWRGKDVRHSENSQSMAG